MWESHQLEDYCSAPSETCLGSEGGPALHNSREH